MIIKNSYNDFFEYINNVNNENKLQAPKKRDKKLVLCINILLISLFISGGYGIKYLSYQNDIKESDKRQNDLILSQQNTAKGIKKNLEKKDDKINNINKDFDNLKIKNPDTVAWLYVPGTEIDIQIMQANDNSYYLTHDFDKNSSSDGWPFADKSNEFSELSTNTIIYGNNYKINNKLSSLKNLLNSSWLNNEENYNIILDTEKERLKFQVFSVYTLDNLDDYLYIDFESKEKYQEYLDKSIKRSIKDFNIKPGVDDKILTLSTCYEDDKIIVVQAKLIRSE